MIGNAHHDAATEILYGGGKRERGMRPDAPAMQQLPRQTAQAYAARWNEWSPLCLLSMNGDRSTPRYQAFRQLHHDRITLLHQALGISLKIIARRQLDDPRISEPELQRRIRETRLSREKMNPWKNKKGAHANQ